MSLILAPLDETSLQNSARPLKHFEPIRENNI
jgi:hypothetical protein